ncbi:hypothetical protein M9Y10_019088 [Tritrichomonas musculus]|uniref:Uncharacterized protein n=1 Tax=Tritrichomonas musculus TaxID=1915356 RepID=A0ABR2HIP2_9EUKA
MAETITLNFLDIRNFSDICTMEEFNFYISFNRFMTNPHYQQKLVYWRNYYMEEDQQNLNDDGFTKEMFQKLSDKATEMINLFTLPYEYDEGSYNNLFAFYYKQKIDQINHSIIEFQQIYDQCQSDSKDKKLLIERDLYGNHLEKDIFEVYNPFAYIPQIIPLLNKVEKGKFEILATINEDIKNKGLNNDELNAFNKLYSSLILKGFALWQIKIKINEKEILHIKDKESFVIHKNEVTDDDIQKYSEKKNFEEYCNHIYDCTDEIDYAIIEQIYKNHSNDEVGKTLRPLIEELIPYYKSLITVPGMIKIMFDFSKYYQPFIYAKNLHFFWEGEP